MACLLLLKVDSIACSLSYAACRRLLAASLRPPRRLGLPAGRCSLPLCPRARGPATHHTSVNSSIHLQEDAACTFAPDTAASQPLLAVAAHPHGHETYLERVERLAFKDKQRQNACRSATADHYYAQFSFKPQINERSRRIARVRHQWRRLWVDWGSGMAATLAPGSCRQQAVCLRAATQLMCT